MIHIKNDVNEAIIYADEIDSGARGLLNALCASPLSEWSKIRVMPDVHAGKGSAVGMTMTITDRVAPGIVGSDIGCGMSALKVAAKRMELQKLDRILREKVPAGSALRKTPHRFADSLRLDELLCGRHVQTEKALRSIGTLGGGNHFVELDKSEDGSWWLVIHSGSRHLGAEVSGFYHDAAFRACDADVPYEFAFATGALMDDYLHDVEIAQEYAETNRNAIADELIKGMKLTVIESFSCVHNYVDLDARVLRKGAISAKKGERLIIPMNMRDGCLLCEGKGNPEWNYSAPHGAGRALSRVEARERTTLSQFKKEMKGIYSTSISRDTLDESPMAYKPMSSILDQIEPTAEVLERIRPVYNFKAGAQ